MKVVESFFCQKPCSSIVEVWIKFVNNTLKSQYRKQPSWKCWNEMFITMNKNWLIMMYMLKNFIMLPQKCRKSKLPGKQTLICSFTMVCPFLRTYRGYLLIIIIYYLQSIAAIVNTIIFNIVSCFSGDRRYSHPKPHGTCDVFIFLWQNNLNIESHTINYMVKVIQDKTKNFNFIFLDISIILKCLIVQTRDSQELESLTWLNFAFQGQ